MNSVWSEDNFRERFNVSRETSEDLQVYLDTLEKWNPRINLISKESLSEVWSRHMADSAQIYDYRPDGAKSWCDLGSGAGFPGLVISILAKNEGAPINVSLVESDARKCAFLMEVIRKCSLGVKIENARIDDVPALNADVISARALAPLTMLLGFAEKHRRPDGICLFHKGRSVHKEVQEARVTWNFDFSLHPSLTDPEAAVVEIGAFSRV